MTFNETIAANDGLRELVVAMAGAGAYIVPLDDLMKLCEIMFDTGVQAERLVTLKTNLSHE